MRVQDVYSPNIVHIPFSCMLQEATQQMRQKRISALVVMENTPFDLCAIDVVTDRDMVLDAVAVGASPSQTCVADVMSRGILNIPLDASLSDVLQEMLSSGVRRVGAASDGALVGMLSLGGVLGVIAIELGLTARLVYSERKRETTGSVQPPLSM